MPTSKGINWQDYDPDLAAQKQAAILKALREAPAVPSQGQMVGGQYIRPHWSQQLGAALNQAMSGYAAGQEVEANARTRQKAQEDFNKWAGSIPTTEQKPVDLPYLAAPDQGPDIGATATVPASRETRLKHALAGMTNPLSRDVASAAVQDIMFKEPEREEARAFRGEEADKNRQAAAEVYRQKAQDRIEEIKMRLEDRNLDRASREQMARESRELQSQIAKMNDATRRDTAQMRIDAMSEKLQKPLPPAQATAWINNRGAIKNIDNVMGLLEDENGKIRPEAEQHLSAAYMLPGAERVGQALDPKGVDIRSKIADIGSLKIHDRSGAAVTASETPRLRPFIPSISDTPKAAAQKLKNFKKQYEMMNQEIEDYADAQNYKSPVRALPKAVEAVRGAAPNSGKVRKFNPATGDFE